MRLELLHTLIEFPTRLMMICRNLPGSPIRILGTFSDMYTASCSKNHAEDSTPTKNNLANPLLDGHQPLEKKKKKKVSDFFCNKAKEKPLDTTL
jgi:hypothetical protein